MQFNPVEVFLNEAEDLLAVIEEIALDLTPEQGDPETLNQLFRAFHTIKGSGGMVGFDEVSVFAHRIENVLEMVRSGSVPVSPEVVQLVLAGRDEIRSLLRNEDKGSTEARARQNEIGRLLAAFSTPGNAPAASTAPATSGPAAPDAKQNWNIRFRPDPGLMACGGNPVLLFRDLVKLGECRVEAHTDLVPALDEMQPDSCYLWWTITLETAADENAIRDVFLFVEDGSELEIAVAAEQAREARPVANQPEQDAPRKQADAAVHKAITREASVRVPSARLDRLVSLVGELVMNQSRLAEAASRLDAPELAGPAEELERLVAELRDDVLSIRMMPIGTIFGRFRRLVHDLSAELGKEIELVTEGADTELDKSILDQLGEPLVHMLRNSIDHGIELPEQRVQKGKPRQGTVRLTAVHTGSDVVVSIEDDGRGLDRAVIRAKAVEKQLIPADAVISDKEILNLILLPGFSTASKVTNVSGRGVGMDVVRKQIDALRGTLSISSEPGQGTKFALNLPLTLAIIDGLLVELNHDQFIIPMSDVTENVELQLTERQRNNGRNVIPVRGELVPYVDLRGAFRMGGADPKIAKVVLVRYEDQRVGLVVDRVLGTHQTVIQSLGKFFRRTEVVSGATIMGDGSVALIFDVPGVVRHANREARVAGIDSRAAVREPVLVV